MSYREQLPQLQSAAPFLTDGWLETTLIFHRGIDLPHFAAFDLLKDEAGTDALRAYFEPYLELARDGGVGFVLDTATWRANPDWGARLGYSDEGLREANRRAVGLAERLRADYETDATPIVIDGVVGPRGDGYVVGETMTADDAERYHADQIGTFADTAADMVTAVTMTYVEEAIGIVRAASAAGMPVVISFTVETDGRLPSGQPLGEAVGQVDSEKGEAAAYFMINCAHPTHFESVLDPGAEGRAAWQERIRGLRANASTMSHAELDEAEELDDGDPVDLGARYAALRPRLVNLTVLGGCCGTDQRHVGEICRAWPAAA